MSADVGGVDMGGLNVSVAGGGRDRAQEVLERGWLCARVALTDVACPADQPCVVARL